MVLIVWRKFAIVAYATKNFATFGSSLRRKRVSGKRGVAGAATTYEGRSRALTNEIARMA